MNLKGRLKLIADKVPPCEILCDIGTDHAYLPIYLVKNGICKRAIASDVRKGPAMIARRNVRAYSLEAYIDVRVGSGLRPIGPNEVNTIVIAGMGGLLISEILEDEIQKASKAACIILQPMNAIEMVRQWLYDHCFSIEDEELAAEGEKIYNVLVCRPVATVGKIEPIDYYIGKKLIEKKDPLLACYLSKKIHQINVMLKGLNNSHSEESRCAIEKYSGIRNEMQHILENFLR